MSDCKHPNLQARPDYEGDGTERRLTRYFTTYYCPDCDLEAESPPPGWEPDVEPPDDDNPGYEYYEPDDWADGMH